MSLAATTGIVGQISDSDDTHLKRLVMSAKWHTVRPSFADTD